MSSTSLTTLPSPPRPSFIMLYGSQSGCAEEVAQRIAREARRYRFTRVICTSMDQYDKVSGAAQRTLPTESLVIFVCSTTGQGEPPDNMKSFYRFILRRDLPPNSLPNLAFGVFGLGDSSYPLFNAIARRLHQRLIDLGGTPLLERGLGDDQATRGLDEALDPWLEELWKCVLAKYPMPPGLEVIDYKTMTLAEPKYHIEIIKDEEKKSPETPMSMTPRSSTQHPVLLPPVQLPPFLQQTPAQRYTPVPIRLLVNKRLTPEKHFQDVRHLEFEIPSSSTASSTSSPTTDFTYSPGDVLLIHPRNLVDENMIAFLERTYQFDYHRDSCRIMLTRDWKKQQAASNPELAADDQAESEVEINELPLLCSIRDLFELHLDLLGTPRRYFFEQLSSFSTTELEKEKLQEFCNPINYPDFARYCVKEKRMYIEALQDFPHSIPPLSNLISMIPRLQPRQFSIASSPAMFPGRIHILLAVLSITTPFKRHRTGVISSFLATLKPELGDIYIPCWIKKSLPGAQHFHPPADLSKPLICIGPGTGVAPFRAIIQERAARKRVREEEMYEFEPETNAPGTPNGRTYPPILLFFGNRNREADYFYQDEWKQYQLDHVLEIEAVFSRDPSDETGDTSENRMRYVQHALQRKRGSQIARMLFHDGGTVMVAGSANAMPKDVRQTILNILQRYGPDGSGCTLEEATEHLKQMDKNRRYLVEAW